MTRRDFLQQTSKASLALPLLRFPDFMETTRMGIVVHSYASRWNSKVESAKYPGFKDAIDLLRHCHKIGAGGVQVIVRDWSQEFSRKVRDVRENLGLFLEGSITLPKETADVSRFEKDILAAKEAGAAIVRTACLSGRRYENFQTLAAFREFQKSAVSSMELAEPIMRKHGVKLAIENHKDWLAPELADVLGKMDSEWIGVNLDFGNNLALIEDPMEVIETLAPYVFSTHVKDMGVKEYEDGFLLSEVPLGEGVLDLKKIFATCKKHRSDVNFNLEMITRDPLKIPCLKDEFWETLPSISTADLAGTLRLVRQKSFKTELPVTTSLSSEEKLRAEEENILASLRFSKTHLGMS